MVSFEKPMSNLTIYGGSKADSTDRAFMHRVVLVFKCPSVGSKLASDMWFVVKLTVIQYVPKRVFGGYTVIIGE